MEIDDMPTKRMGAAAIIFDYQGQVLLVKHSYGHLNWELPGGAAEADESILATALREVWEETGLEAAGERLTGIYYDAETDGHHFAFLCTLVDEAKEPKPDMSEITECAYWPPDALPRPISDFTIRRIKDALSESRPVMP